MTAHRSPILWSAFESGGGQALGAGPTALTFDTLQFPIAGITLTGGSLITFTNQEVSGLWKFDYYMNRIQAGARTSYDIFLALNGLEYGGARNGNYARTNRDAGPSVPGVPVLITPGDTVQIQAVRTVGTGAGTVAPNGGRVTCWRVE